MLVTIIDYLKKLNIDVNQTVYRDEKREILEFPLILGEFLSFEKRGNEFEQFQISEKITEMGEDYKRKDTSLFSMEVDMDILSVLLKMLREDKDTRVIECIREAREIKRKVSQYYQHRMDEIETQCIEDLLGKNEELSEQVIWYKNTVFLTTLQNLSRTVPIFSNMNTSKLFKMPLFVSGMEKLHQALDGGDPIGVVGGPCLLGHDEVIIEIIHRDKGVHRFDFATPRSYEADEQHKEDLHRHIKAYTNEIIDIKFINKKKYLTKGDLLGILYVFEAAKALEAKAVIPLVDMSYLKYIHKVCEELEESLRGKAQAAFQDVIYKICDIFIEWIAVLKERYSEVEIEAFHERNEAFCNMFYNGRKDYLANYKRLETITNEEAKKESIIDYVTMPALPFYKWGIKDIVQIDCISELDSYKRCKKIHGKDINLTGIFYSETLSLDQKHSDYSAKYINKNYLIRENDGV